MISGWNRVDKSLNESWEQYLKSEGVDFVYFVDASVHDVGMACV